MKKRLFLIASAALVLAACAKEEAYQFEESPIAGRTKISIGASFELPESGATKSDIDDDGNFTWAKTDAIWIGSDYTVDTDGETFSRLEIDKTLSGEIGPGYINARFIGSLIGRETAVAAISPAITYNKDKPDYNAEPRFSENKLYVSLPKARVWNEAQVSSLNTGSKLTRQADNLLIARYKDIYDGGYEQGRTEGLEFKNAGGLFRLELAKLPTNATKVVFTTDKKINGEFLVEDTVEKDVHGNDVHYPVINTSVPSVDEEKSVSFDILVTDSNKSDRVLYIPVPVGQYKIGFKVLDGNDNDKVLWEFSTSRSNTVRRGHMVKMPPLTFVSVGGSGEGATNIIVTPEGYTGTVYLPSTENNIYVRMYGTTGPINIEYSQNGDLKPANVYLQALGDITTLNINLPESHVELTGEDKVHTLTNVKANTSIGTFVVDNKVKIGKEEVADSGLKITGGSLNLQAPTQKVTIDIPESAANTTAHKVQININSTIKALAVDRAAYTEKVADKIYVKLAPPVSETPTAITVEGINVKEKNCNLWVAKGVTVTSVATVAAENTVAGGVTTLTATGEGTIVNVTSGATVTTTAADDGATVIVDSEANVTNTDNNGGRGTIITGVDSESVAIVGSTSYKTFDEAVDAAVTLAAESATITIIKEGDYTIPAIAKNLTIVGGVEGVNFNHTGASAVTTITSGKTLTLKNIALNLDKSFYQGFGTSGTGANAGALVMENCSIDGSLSLFGVSTFKNCTFTANDANAGAYNIWAVYSNATFTGCSFTNTNRAVNVYDPACGSTRKTVTFTNCSFTASEKKKAAINIHHNPAPVQASGAKFDVVITNCTTSGTWASSVAETGEPADATICNSALWMVSDILNWTNGDITVNGENVYEVFVAQIKDVKYATIKDAFAAVPDNIPTTITMIANAMINVAGSALTVPTNKDITLDLNGFQVVGTAETGNTSALITNNGTLTIKDSSDSNADGTGTGKLISGATPTWKWDGSDNFSGSYASNTITNCGTLTIESGYLQNTSSGSATYAVDNNSGSRTATLNVNGGYLTAVSTVVRQFCNSTKNQNTVNITAGSIATSGKAGIWTQLPGGNNQEKLATLNVTGGTVSAATYAWYDYSFGDSFAAVNYAISGGTFTGLLYSYAVINGVKPGFITGGTFDSDPSDLVAAGYEAVENGNGTWTVQKLQGVAKIGTTTYATLAEAVAAVPTTGGETTTITMVADVANATGMSVAAGKNFTVDFNNHTYTLNKPGAGSAGTETIGFQLLQGSTITFKNGTINISEENLAKATIGNNIKRVIQNYANLTLDSMTIDGTNQYDKKDYVVSFNNGTSVIKDTKIKGADASKVIFDVCTWATYVATSVTVSGKSEIDGNIEVSASNTPEILALTLTGGTHNGSLVMGTGADKATITKSNDFIEVAPEGYSWKSNGDGTSTLIANVAKIEDSYYATLEAAVAAVQSEETIVLLSDLTQDNGILYNKEGVNAKLNLNGNTITVNSGSNINNRAFRIDNGTLEVYGGSIVAVGAGTTSSNGSGCYGAFRVEAAGKLVAHDLSLTNSRPWGLNVKVCGGEAELTNVNITSSYGGGIEVTEKTLGGQSQKGKATLTNCTFDQKNYFDHCSTPISVSGGSELTVNSGTYTSENHVLYVFSSGGVITVNGGTFQQATGSKAAIVAEIDLNTYPTYTGGLQINGGSYTGSYSIKSPAYMSITGGTFTVDPSAYVAPGYEAVQSSGNNWKVQVKNYTCTVYTPSTNLSGSLDAPVVSRVRKDEAVVNFGSFSNLEAGQVIELTEDVYYNGTVSIPAGVVLDFNGHKLTATKVRGLNGNAILQNTLPYNDGQPNMDAYVNVSYEGDVENVEIRGGTYTFNPQTYTPSGIGVVVDGTSYNAPGLYFVPSIPEALVYYADYNFISTNFSGVTIGYNGSFGKDEDGNISSSAGTFKFKDIKKYESINDAFIFQMNPQEEYATSQSYNDWICDYVVSVKEGENGTPEEPGLGLWGMYGGMTVGFGIGFNLAANEKYPLISSLGFNFDYTGIKTTVSTFICGTLPFNNDLIGKTVYVDLCLFPAEGFNSSKVNKDQNYKYIVVKRFDYKF